MISIRTAKLGGASRLASAHTVHNLMLDLCPDLLKMLYEGFVCRMPDSDAEAMGVPPLIPRRVPAYKFENGWLNCHYVRGYVTRAVAAGDHAAQPARARRHGRVRVARQPSRRADRDAARVRRLPDLQQPHGDARACAFRGLSREGAAAPSQAAVAVGRRLAEDSAGAGRALWREPV